MTTWQEFMQTHSATRNIETNVTIHSNEEGTYNLATPSSEKGTTHWDWDITASAVTEKLNALGLNATSGWR